MDIDSLKTRQAHDAGAEMRVRGPNGKLTDLYISFVGIDSTLWGKILADLERDAFEKKEIDKFESLSKAATGWRNATANGKPVEFSQKNLQNLLKDAPYIYDQANKFIADRKNFTKPSPSK